MKTRSLLIVAIIIALIVGLLPFGIQYGLVRQVGDMGYGDLTIENTDFNPFSLKLELHDYSLVHGGKSYLDGDYVSIDLAWLPLLQGKVGVEAVVVNRVELWAREERSDHWVLFPEPPESLKDVEEDEGTTESPAIEYSLQALSISDAKLHVEGQQLKGDFELPSFSLEDLANQPMLATATTTEARAIWNGSDISLTTSNSLMDENPPFEVDLVVTDLPLADFRGAAGLPVLSGAVDLELDIRGQLSRTPLLASAAPLNVELEVQTILSVRDLRASDPDGHLLVAGETIVWQGTSSISFDTDGARIETEGQLEAGKTRVTLPEEAESTESAGFLLAGWDTLNVDDFRLGSSNQVGIGKLQTRGLELLSASLPMIAVDVDAEAIEFVPAERVSVGSLLLNGLKAQIIVDESGEIQELARLNELIATFSAEESEPAASTVDESAPDTLAMLLGSLSVAGEVVLADRSVVPPFEETLTLEKLTLSTVDTSDQDLQSSLVFRGRLGEYSRIDVDANLARLTGSRLVDADIRLNQLPMDRFSAYLERALGYEVKTGQMDLESTVHLEDQHLKAEIDTTLRKFRVNKAADSELDSQLGMPLGAALSLVRDNDDNITLDDILIEGDLGDPSVSAAAIVSKAMSKALQAGAMTYFTFALQPYGAALMVAKTIRAQAGKVTLEPMQMEPMLPEIAPGNLDYIERLSELMKQRPGIHLIICGEASEQVDVPEPEAEQVDVPEPEAEPVNVSETEPEPAEVATDPVAVDEAPLVDEIERAETLISLADARADAVKAALFEKGVASERLLICKSSINDAQDGARVVLSID